MSSIRIEGPLARWGNAESQQQAKIFLAGVSSGLLLCLLVTKGPHALLQATIGNVLSIARQLPGVSDMLEQAEGAVLQELVDEIAPIDAQAMKVIPRQGQAAQEVIAFINKSLQQDMSHGFNDGRSFAGIYHFPHSVLSQVQSEVLKSCLDTNLLYPTVFKTCRKMEAEVVTMVVNILKGQLGLSTDVEGDVDCAPEACGLLTTGGTESILLAVKAYRDEYYAKYGSNAKKPEVIACITCHPALDKACHYFQVVLHKLPSVEGTQAFDLDLIQKYLTPQTCMIYASAPSFPHGVVDPVPELAAIAHKHGVGLHVDNCLGGVLLSYAYALQQQQAASSSALARIPMFDFRVEGVTSVSIDVHKYGCAPKGASVVAFRTEELRRQVYSVVTNWPGGLYATPTATGSRSGGMAACAWATMKFIGGEGYAKMTADVQGMTSRIVDKIQRMPTLRIVGQPHACIIAFTTTPQAPFQIYSLAARMEAKGFHVNSIHLPTAIAFCVSERFASIIEAWIEALQQCVQEAIANPNEAQFEGKGDAGIYGASVVLPGNEIERILKRYCDIMYLVRDK